MPRLRTSQYLAYKAMAITRAPFRVYKFRGGVGDGSKIHGRPPAYCTRFRDAGPALSCAPASLKIFAQLQYSTHMPNKFLRLNKWKNELGG